MPDIGSPALNPPLQPRSRKTLERIVVAALELLEAEGPDGLTVHAVVARAKSSVGSFYARFGGKEDLLEYLAERVWEEALTRWNAAVAAKTWSDMALPDLTEGAIGLLIDIQRSRVGRLRELDRMSGGGDAYERFRGHLVASLETLLLEREAEMSHPTPQLAVRLGLTAVQGLIDAGPVESIGGTGGPDLSRDELVRECTTLLLGYWGGAEGGGKEPVEFFDVWG